MFTKFNLFKKKEPIKDEPQIGMYVIINADKKVPEPFRTAIENQIGIIISEQDIIANDKTHEYEKYYHVKYDESVLKHVNDYLKTLNLKKEKILTYLNFSIKQIEFFSLDKEIVEAYIISKNYNL